MSLDPEQRRQLASQVASTIEQLISEIATLEQLVAPIAPDRAIGRLSRLEAMNERSMHEAALRSARQRLRRLQQVRDEVDDELFGMCAQCEQAIPFARLMSLPESVLCVACRERREG